MVPFNNVASFELRLIRIASSSNERFEVSISFVVEITKEMLLFLF